MDEGDDSERKDDVVLLHSPTESGDGIRVVRKRDEAIELGELRPMREGQPIHGEVVRLTQREEHSLLFDCEVVVPSKTRTEPKAEAKTEAKAEPTDAPKLPAPARSRDKDTERDMSIGHKGPPRVTSDAYRGGWDLIFGGKTGGSNGAPN